MITAITLSSENIIESGDFDELIKNKTLIVGRKTFSQRRLAGKNIIVLSSSFGIDGAFFVRNWESAIKLGYILDSFLYIVGGFTTFLSAYPYLDRIAIVRTSDTVYNIFDMNNFIMQSDGTVSWYVKKPQYM